MSHILSLQSMDSKSDGAEPMFSTVSAGACGSTISLFPGLCFRTGE